MKSILIFDKISKVSLYLLVVLLPLWFLPFTQNILEYQKQALLVVLVFVGAASWLAKMVYEGEVKFRLSWLHVPVAGVLLVFGLSTLFSVWQYGSFWGWPLHTTDNFLTFFAFGLLYFLISQSLKDARHLFFLLAGFLISGALAVVFALVQMKEIFVLPFEFAQAKNFNTLGTSRSIALFAAVLLPLALGLAPILNHKSWGKAWKGVLLGVAVLLFVSLAFLDFSSAWIAMIAGLIALLVFDLWSQTAAGRISLPMVFVLVALFFLIVGNFSIPGAPVKQAEISLDLPRELAIIKSIASISPSTLLIGSGPGTFVLDYTKFRSADLNQTIFWNTRFSSGRSELLDWVSTKGVGGLIMLTILIGAAAVLAVKNIMQKEGGDEEHGDRKIGVGLFASLIASTVSLALYPANFALWFALWIILGSLGFLVSKPRAVSLSSGRSFAALGSSLLLVMAVIAAAGLLLIGGQKYYAEMAYLKGARASQLGNAEEAAADIAQAANLNPSMDLYWRDLAQLHLAKANLIAADQSLPADARAEQTGAVVRSAVDAAKKAAEVGPANVANWNVQGFVYRSLIGMRDAERLAIASYEKARELEPVSPFPWTELGRVKILQAQVLKNRGGSADEIEKLLGDALADLERAVELKPDYAPAHYLIAAVHDQLGNPQEAIRKLEETKLAAPNDIGLAFQLGMVYYQRDELEKAREEFERAKLLNPGYSNARYMLGLVYDRLGRSEDAKAEFAAVLALNPENQEVKAILANLAAGLPALSGIGQPSQPPIEDNPPEITEEQTKKEQ